MNLSFIKNQRPPLKWVYPSPEFEKELECILSVEPANCLSNEPAWMAPKMGLHNDVFHSVAVKEFRGEYIDEFQRLNNDKLERTCALAAKAAAAGDEDAKQNIKKYGLPAIVPMATYGGQPRSAKGGHVNGIGLTDTDHIKGDVRAVWRQMVERGCQQLGVSSEKELCEKTGVRCVHITPSGKGLRIYFERKSIDLMDDVARLDQIFHFSEYGDIDTSCKDVSRCSFLPPRSHMIYGCFADLSADVSYDTVKMIQEARGKMEPKQAAKTKAKPAKSAGGKTSAAEPTSSDAAELPQEGKYDDYEVDGRRVKDVIEAFIQHRYGEVKVGHRHTTYGEVARLFAPMCDCKTDILYALVPRLDPDMSDHAAYNFCARFCDTNNSTRYAQEVSDFLPIYDAMQNGGVYAEEEEEEKEEGIPFPEEIAPVYDQLIPLYQEEFREPIVFVLSCIMGWKCMNYCTPDPTDPNSDRLQRPQFITALLGGPNSGKGFKEAFIQILAKDEDRWQQLYWAVKQVYEAECEGKSPSKKPRAPKPCLRKMPEKTTFAAFFKNLEAAQGKGVMYNTAEASRVLYMMTDPDLSSALRDSFDGGPMEKIVATEGVEGRAELALSVAFSAQINTLRKFAQNETDLENGLPTRICTTVLDTRKRGLLGIKPLSDEARAVIDETLERIKADTYSCVPTCTPKDILRCKSLAEANKLGWKPEYKPLKMVNIDFIYPTLDAWKAKMAQEARAAETDIIYAFYPRVATRALRFSLLLTVLHNENPEKQEVIKKAVEWWLKTDMRNCLQVWGEQYTKMAAHTELPDTTKKFVTSVFGELPDEFTRDDVDKLQKKYHQKTEARKVVSKWMKANLIKKVEKNKWQKVLLHELAHPKKTDEA